MLSTVISRFEDRTFVKAFRHFFPGAGDTEQTSINSRHVEFLGEFLATAVALAHAMIFTAFFAPGIRMPGPPVFDGMNRRGIAVDRLAAFFANLFNHVFFKKGRATIPAWSWW